MPPLSILLAVVASVAFGFGTVLQQGTARATALRHGDGRRTWLPVLAILHRLLRDRRWLLGWLLIEFGFACHVLALHFGAIAVVQAVLVLQLLVALLVAAGRRSLRPTPRDWAGAVAVCAGIVILVLLRGDVEQREVAESTVLGYAGYASVVIAALLVTARALRRHAQTRTALVAVSAGICFSTSAVFVVVVTAGIAHSGVFGAVGWPLLGIVVSSIVGTLLVQDAYTSGSMPTAVTAMTITDPICSALVGVLLFDAVPPAGPELLLGLPLSAALVVTGVTLLATSPTIHDERGQTGTAVAEAWRASSEEIVRSHG